MKKTFFVAFALAASAVTGIAQAAMSNDHAARNTVAAQVERMGDAQNAGGKTRADVRRELVQAQRSGQIAALANLYRGS